MEGVGAGFGYRADRRAGANRSTRFLRAGGELELLERVGEGQMHARAVEVVQVRRAVE